MSAPFGPAPGCSTSYRRITFALRIGQQRKRVPELLRLPLVNIRRIDADADNANATCLEFRKPVAENSATRSCIAVTKNRDRKSARRPLRVGKQIAEANRFSILIQ